MWHSGRGGWGCGAGERARRGNTAAGGRHAAVYGFHGESFVWFQWGEGSPLNAGSGFSPFRFIS